MGPQHGVSAGPKKATRACLARALLGLIACFLIGLEGVLDKRRGKESNLSKREKYDPSLPLAFKIARLFGRPSWACGVWRGANEGFVLG